MAAVRKVGSCVNLVYLCDLDNVLRAEIGYDCIMPKQSCHVLIQMLCSVSKGTVCHVLMIWTRCKKLS